MISRSPWPALCTELSLGVLDGAGAAASAFGADSGGWPTYDATGCGALAPTPPGVRHDLTRPVRTHGLTPVAIAVRGPRRSLEFNRTVLEVVAVHEDDAFLQAQTPGSRDVLLFERNARAAGKDSNTERTEVR